MLRSKTSAVVVPILLILAVAWGQVPQAEGDVIYTGFLSSDPGDSPDGSLSVGGDWSKGTLSWEVSLNEDLTWHYKYTFTVDGPPAISHFIIEASDNPAFTIDNFFNLLITVDDATEEPEIEIQDHASGGSNPGIPEDYYGIKIGDFGDGTTATFEFDSDRIPVWGDFSAKAGTTAFALNDGFTLSDNDPTDFASNGSINNHLLVPDSVTTHAPEPTTAALLAFGGCGLLLGWHRRRRIARAEAL